MRPLPLFLFCLVCLTSLTQEISPRYELLKKNDRSVIEAPQHHPINVIAYYFGKAEQVDALPTEKLSHIIFSFCHLKGNRLVIDSPADSVTITKLVALKMRNRNLKIMLALGGWGGCAPCSDVFSSSAGREDFAKSVSELNQRLHTDGIDMDWEYPAIEGFPGHSYKTEDRENFTAVIVALRKNLGPQQEISFAAGGFKKYLEESVDWKAVTPFVDRINLMSYDLVNGYSTVTGHHTPLYSSKHTTESVDRAVQYLIKHGVPGNKIVIGAAFYARMWENVSSIDNGLYQPGHFKGSVNYKNIEKELTAKNGFHYYWDDSTKAPYLFNPEKGLFATFDDKRSIELKTKYSMDQGLQGIMFWELSLDSSPDGLLSVIDKVKKGL